MGNAKSQFAEVAIGTADLPAADKLIIPPPPKKTIPIVGEIVKQVSKLSPTKPAPPMPPTTYTVTKAGDAPWDVGKLPTFTVLLDDEAIFTMVASPFMTTGGKEMSVYDVSGALVLVTKYSMGFGSYTTTCFKTSPTFEGQESKGTPYNAKDTPVYEFATIVAKTGYTNTGTYTVGKDDTPLYVGKLVSTMHNFVTIETADGTIVGKVAPSGKNFSVEIAAGCDALAVVLLAQATIGSAYGGNVAGALAGAM